MRFPPSTVPRRTAAITRSTMAQETSSSATACAELVPSLGTNNIVANYRVGAGSAGNVPKGAVAQLESPVAGVASVANPLSADSGADIETADIVQQRGPQTLRHRGRAVSRTDFEWLAREAAGTRLARVVCLSNTNRNFLPKPGWVTLVIVPQGTERRLVPSAELIHHVEESVGNRAFAGLSTFNRLNVTGPSYVEVAVAADIVLDDLRRASQVKRQVTDALDKFLHPLTGGPSADGWELGRNVFASEIASVIQAVSGARLFEELAIDSQPGATPDRARFLVCQPCQFARGEFDPLDRRPQGGIVG